MPLIANGTYTVLQENIRIILQELSDSQALIDPLVAFNVYKNRLITFDEPSEITPFVNIWVDSLVPNLSASSQSRTSQETVNFNLDMYARGKVEDLQMDESAFERLFYLADQVKFGLLSLINYDFGFPPGAIAKKVVPTLTVFRPDISSTEKIIPAARWSFDIEYGYVPQDQELVDVSSIFVDTGRAEILVNY